MAVQKPMNIDAKNTQKQNFMLLKLKTHRMSSAETHMRCQVITFVQRELCWSAYIRTDFLCHDTSTITLQLIKARGDYSDGL